MNKFLDALSDKLLPLANVLGSNKYLAVLRDAFMLSFPITMFGSLIVVLTICPSLMMIPSRSYIIFWEMVKWQLCLL